MNELGLGVVFDAKDLATGTFSKVSKGLLDVTGASSEAGKAIKSNFATFSTGLAVMGAGLAGLAMLGPASHAASEFAFQIARIRTVIDEASFSTDDLRKTTMGLAASYGIDALQQADGLYETISAGIMDADKATQLLETANEFAVGGTTSLKGAVDVLTSAVNTYADKGLTAAMASDLMFTAIAAGKTTAEELSASLGMVAPTAHAAGVSFAELQAAIAAMTVQGIKTPQAITGINAVLANLIKPAKDAQDEAKRIGIQFDATALKTKGLKGVLDQLVGNTKIKDDTFGKLFGSIEGIKAALSLTAGGGAKFNEILKQMEGASGATGKAFEIMAATGKFQGTRFEAMKQNALILIGQGLDPLKGSVLKVANAVLEGFSKIPKPVIEFAVKVFAAVSAVLALVGGLIAAKAGFALLLSGLSAIGITVGSFIATVAPMLLLFGVLVLAVQAFRVAFEHDIGGIATFFTDLYKKVSLTVRALGQLIEEGGFSGAVLDELDAGNQGVENFAISIYLVVTRIINFWEELVDGFRNGLEEAKPSFQAFVTMIEGVAVSFGLVNESVDPTASSDKFAEFGSSGMATGKALAKSAELIVMSFTAAGNAVIGFNNAAKPVMTDIKDIAAMFADVATTIKEVAVELGLMDKATADSAGAWGAFGSAVAGYISAVLGPIKALFSITVAVWKGIISIFGGVFEILSGNVESGVKRILYGVLTLITGIFGGLMQFMFSIGDAIWKIFGVDFGAAKKIGEMRKSLDETLKVGLGLKEHTFAKGSEEAQLDEERTAKEARAFYAPDPDEARREALAFYAPEAPAAAVDQAQEDGGSSVNVEELNASVGALKAAKEGPVTVEATMVVDQGVLGKVSMQAQRDAAGDGAAPVSIMFE